MDIFIDIGFTLMGGPKLSPPKKIRSILGLEETALKPLSEIVFTENHKTADALASSIGRTFQLEISEQQRSEISEYWDQQYSEVYAIEGAHSLLETLVKHDVNMHIVSNLWFPFYKKFTNTFHEMLQHIKSETLSFKDGVKKPSAEFYNIALERSKALPAESIMIGDSVGNDIIPCADLGMKCIWFISRPMEENQLKDKRAQMSYSDEIFETNSLMDTERIIERILTNGSN